MGLPIFSRMDFLRDGGQTLKLDSNQDKIPEYTLNKTESGSSFEIFDFNSDGQNDVELYYNEKGEFVESIFYDKNGKIYQPKEKEISAQLEQCEALKNEMQVSMIDESFFEEYKGLNDLLKEQFAITQKMKNLQKSLNEKPESTNEKDISEVDWKFKSIG